MGIDYCAVYSKMTGYKVKLHDRTTRNKAYRRVLYTAPGMQLVLMSLQPGEDIGWERHAHTSQFIRVEKGKARVYIGDSRYHLKEDDAVIIPAGQRHNVVNGSERAKLQLYTIYSKKEHKPDTVEIKKPL